MRFYKITVEGGPTFTSLANGQNDPGALDIEFQVQLIKDQTTDASWIKIKGIDPKLIGQASNFNDKILKMWAGYSSGLPLANDQVPHQGLILSGPIKPCFGNWIGNELSLEFFVQPSSDPLGGPTSPKNIVHNMPAGQSLATSIQNTLKVAYPNANVSVDISSKLKLNYPDWGIYQSLEQFGNYIKALSHSILGTPPSYRGVSFSVNGKDIKVTDGTNKSGSIPINFQDLIGQPTWINVGTIQVTTVLRGDMPIPGTGTITLPKTLATQTQVNAFSMTNTSNILNFSGDWQIIGIKHIGKFRSPGSDGWMTIIDALTPSTANAGGSPNSVSGAPAGSSANTPTGPNVDPQSSFASQTPFANANPAITSSGFDPITGQSTTTIPGITNTGGFQSFLPVGTGTGVSAASTTTNANGTPINYGAP